MASFTFNPNTNVDWQGSYQKARIDEEKLRDNQALAYFNAAMAVDQRNLDKEKLQNQFYTDTLTRDAMELTNSENRATSGGRTAATNAINNLNSFQKRMILGVSEAVAPEQSQAAIAQARQMAQIGVDQFGRPATFSSELGAAIFKDPKNDQWVLKDGTPVEQAKRMADIARGSLERAGVFGYNLIGRQDENFNRVEVGSDGRYYIRGTNTPTDSYGNPLNFFGSQGQQTVATPSGNPIASPSAATIAAANEADSARRAAGMAAVRRVDNGAAAAVQAATNAYRPGGSMLQQLINRRAELQGRWIFGLTDAAQDERAAIRKQIQELDADIEVLRKSQ